MFLSSCTTRRVTAVAVIALAAGCAQMFPNKVAKGIAALSVRGIAAMLVLVSDDTRCGFESPEVLASAVVEGEVGGMGKVTWTVEECSFELRNHALKKDCNDVELIADGEVTVSAQKIVTGRITGDPTTPVIPDGPEAATINITEAVFNNFRVGSSHSDSTMTMISGSVSASINPKLAAAAENGVCSVPTSIVRFGEISYGPSKVHVVSPSSTFDADVDGSDFWAQTGEWNGIENRLKGELTVWGGTEDVTDPEGGLDPDYTPEIFAASYACNMELEWPVDFECDISRALGEGAARLSMQTLAGLVTALSDDPTCGFDSPAASLVTSGSVGDAGGSALYTVEGCVLDFPEPTVVDTDCNGVETTIQGRAVVSGTKSLEGILTGDPAEPIVPLTRAPAFLTVEANLTDLSVSKGGKALVVKTGTLSGNLSPRTALDSATGVCSKVTSVAQLGSVTWNDAEVRIVSDGLTLGLHIDSSSLDAVNGQWDREVNHIAGTISVDGISVAVDADLDPAFDPAAFDASYQCDADMVVPLSDSECAFTETLAQGAARLVIRAFGNVVKAVDDDTICGFASIDGIVPSAAGAAVGDEVSAFWDVIDCVVGGADEPFHLDTDCNGKETWLHGTASVTATKSADGLLAIGYPPILPTYRTSARFDMHQIVLNGFTVANHGSLAEETASYMTIHSATMTGIGLPVTGEAADTPGAYFIALPVTGFENVTIHNASVTIVSEGKTFNLHLDSTDLDAFNGSHAGRSNEIAGSITVSGQRFTMPSETDDGVLDVEFDQEVFDASYVCYENLLETVPVD